MPRGHRVPRLERIARLAGDRRWMEAQGPIGPRLDTNRYTLLVESLAYLALREFVPIAGPRPAGAEHAELPDPPAILGCWSCRRRP